MNHTYLQFNPKFKLKRTPYGGLVFDPDACRTFSFNETAYDLLRNSFNNPIKRDTTFRDKNDYDTYKAFQNYHVLIPYDSIKNDIQSKLEYDEHPQNTIESIHLLITEKCNQTCDICYANTNKGHELSLEQIKRVIDSFCILRVFQVAIGGGEPFLRKDIIDILEYLHKNDIITTISTNGSLLSEEILRAIKHYVRSIQLSIFSHVEYKHDHLRYPGSLKQTVENISLLKKHKVYTGINLLAYPDSHTNILTTLKFIRNLGISRINLVKYKEPLSLNKRDALKWKETDYELLRIALERFNNDYPEIKLSVDCALSGVMKRSGLPFLVSKGILGCTGGKSYLVVMANGDIYPCCFLNTQKYKIGNLLDADLKIIIERTNAIYSNDPTKFEDCLIS